MITFLLGIATGVVLKILVRMPFLDDPVRRAYGRLSDWLATFRTKP